MEPGDEEKQSEEAERRKRVRTRKCVRTREQDKGERRSIKEKNDKKKKAVMAWLADQRRSIKEKKKEKKKKEKKDKMGGKPKRSKKEKKEKKKAMGDLDTLQRARMPALLSMPGGVVWSCLASLAIPTLAAVGCTSKSFSRAVFNDEVLWWRVLLNHSPFPLWCRGLSSNGSLQSTIDRARQEQPQGQALPAGTCRQLARNEVQQVQRVRSEEEMRKRVRELLQADERRRQRILQAQRGGWRQRAIEARTQRMLPGCHIYGDCHWRQQVFPGSRA